MSSELNTLVLLIGQLRSEMSENNDSMKKAIASLQKNNEDLSSKLTDEIKQLRSEVDGNDIRMKDAIQLLQKNNENLSSKLTDEIKQVNSQTQEIGRKIGNVEEQLEVVQRKFSELKERVSTVEIMATSALRSGGAPPYTRPSVSLDMAASAGTRDHISKRRNFL